jgi:hypothetical protein
MAHRQSKIPSLGAPALKMPARARPLHSPELRVKLDIKHLGDMPENAEVELAPDKFADELFRAFLSRRRKAGRTILTFSEALPNGQQTEAKILGKS